MMNEEVSKEELLNFVNSGNGFLLKFYTIEYKDGYGKFFFTNGEEDAVLRVKVNNKAEFEELKKAVKETLKARYGRVVYKEENEDKEKKGKGTTLRLIDSLKMLDKTFAQQIAAYAKRQGWFSELIEDLGITTLFMILQIAHIPPHQWYDEIRKYKDDPRKFTEFIDRFLIALYEAKEDAEALLEMRSKYYYCVAEREALKLQLKDTQRLLQDAITQLNAAMAMLPKEKLQQFAMWNAFRRMAEAQPVAQAEIVEKEGEENE